MTHDPYAPPRARVDGGSPGHTAQRLSLRVLCFVLGAVPGAVLAVGAAFMLIAGTAGVILPLIAWGGLGLLGYVAGLTAIFRLPALSKHARKLTIAGIWGGLVSLLPLVFLVFASWFALLLIAGPAASAALLLTELYRDRKLMRIRVQQEDRAERITADPGEMTYANATLPASKARIDTDPPVGQDGS